MRRVVKIGGSLLLRPQLQRDLPAWLSKQSVAETLFIIGGGELIDAIRKIDAIRPGDGEVIHWRCVDLLDTTLGLMHDWLTDWSTITKPEQLQQAARNGFSRDRPTLVSVKAFYWPGHDFDLPKDWRTTTDAIAAALAIEVSADELVLLKSCEVDATQSIEDLASAGVVDEALLLIANRVRAIRVECLAK